MQREPYENYGARNATIIDPFGHRWMLSGPVTGAPIQIQHGDVGYVSVWTPDADRAAAFYGHVLGWTYDPQTHQVTNTREHIGVYSVNVPPDLVLLLCGGRPRGRPAGDPGGRRHRRRGRAFRLRHAASEPPTPTGSRSASSSRILARPVPRSTALGQANFRTSPTRSPDSAAFKAFYSRVLYWTFEPGRIDDGWQVEQTHPMAGVAGGSAQPVIVPMWTVEDIDAAVARVREAGGTVIDEPSQQPYGRSAQCTDDQGSRFYLGEH